MKRKLMSLLMAVVMCLTLLPFAAFADDASIVDSGICGENLTWTLDSDGILTISGTGNMWDFDERDSSWWEYASNVFNIIIEDGVTSIGADAFCSFRNLTHITIPNSVTNINYAAFSFCSSLPEITLPSRIKSINFRMFSGCENLKSVTIPFSVRSIEDGAFSNCKSLTDIYYLEAEEQWNKIIIGAEDCEYLLEAKIHYSGHTYNDATITKAANCNEDGVVTYMCTVCSSTKTEVIRALGHNYIENVTAPTCMDMGYTTHTCALCGFSYIDMLTPRIAHNFDEWVQTVAPTCVQKGIETHTCTDCGAIEMREGSFGPHYTALQNASKETCTHDGYTGDEICVVCGNTIAQGEVIEADGHHFENGKCVVCGDTDPNYNQNQGNFFTKLINSIRSFFKSIFG